MRLSIGVEVDNEISLPMRLSIGVEDVGNVGFRGMKRVSDVAKG